MKEDSHLFFGWRKLAIMTWVAIMMWVVFLKKTCDPWRGRSMLFLLVEDRLSDHFMMVPPNTISALTASC